MQPAPKKTDTPEVWPLVIMDVRIGAHSLGLTAFWRERLASRMEARHEIGRQKYGVGLQVESGRDPLEDALDEALDGCAYSRQQWERTKDPFDWETHHEFCALAARLLWRIALRDAEGG